MGKNIDILLNLKGKGLIPSEYDENVDTMIQLQELGGDDAEAEAFALDIISAIKNTHPNLIESPKPERREAVQPMQKIKSMAQPQTADQSQVMQQILTLIASMSGQKSGAIDENQVRAIVEKALKNEKIGFDQLKSEVLESIRQSRPVEISVPSIGYKKQLDEKVSDLFWKVYDDVLNGNNVLLIGSAGSGKTYLAKQIARAMGREYDVINCSQWTSPTEIIGGFTMDGYEEGKLIKAWHGTSETKDNGDGHILILDEMPKLDPNTAGLLNDALSLTDENDPKRNAISSAEGKKYTKGKNFGCIATGNVFPNKLDPMYPANNKQDASLLDRFSGNVYFVGYDADTEKRVINNDFVYKFGVAIRDTIEKNKYESAFSIRTLKAFKRAWDIERLRRYEQSQGKDVDPLQGKNFFDAVDSYINQFEETQRSTIKSAIGYEKAKKDYVSVMMAQIAKGEHLHVEPSETMPQLVTPEQSK